MITSALTIVLALTSVAVNSASLSAEFKKLEQQNNWSRLKAVPLKFSTFHPQGLYIIGNKGYLSSVEITKKTERFDKPNEQGFDRDLGKGKAHLFVFDINNGALLKQVELTQGDYYHPGGLDFDGKRLWMALAHYRPNSESKILSLDPESLSVKDHAVVKDHIGAVIFDRKEQKLLGLNWGGRKYYEWKFNPESGKLAEATVTTNPNLYIDYQDCQYVEENQALCFGLARFKLHVLSSTAIGGVELIDTVKKQPIYQVPVLEWLKPYLTMTNNPSFARMQGNDLIFHFVPEDDSSTLYYYKSIKRN